MAMEPQYFFFSKYYLFFTSAKKNALLFKASKVNNTYVYSMSKTYFTLIRIELININEEEEEEGKN